MLNSVKSGAAALAWLVAIARPINAISVILILISKHDSHSINFSSKLWQSPMNGEIHNLMLYRHCSPTNERSRKLD